MKHTVTRTKVTTVAELSEKLGKRVQIGPYEIALFKLSNGSVRAIENRCPHKGGVLSEGMISENSVFCPMHDWKINLDNGKVHEPDIGCVKTYQVEVINDEVYIIL
ncbi:nitrite reductase small subunit NirD [Bacillus seohaeanensis]|jgi:nitrite reductase (NADH) small subunit|uniref:Nitrite reductase small subunit NirD n=1 Tax=Bacillus seohaeanensis TaxID=284580 RepID=A0ABW5RYI7_9BACI